MSFLPSLQHCLCPTKPVPLCLLQLKKLFTGFSQVGCGEGGDRSVKGRVGWFLLPVALAAHTGISVQEEKTLWGSRADHLCISCLSSVTQVPVPCIWMPPSASDKPFSGHMRSSICDPCTVIKGKMSFVIRIVPAGFFVLFPACLVSFCQGFLHMCFMFRMTGSSRGRQMRPLMVFPESVVHCGEGGTHL